MTPAKVALASGRLKFRVVQARSHLHGLLAAEVPHRARPHLRFYSGRIDADEVLRSYEALDAATGSRWLTFVDLAGETPRGMLEDIPVARFPQIKRTLAAKKKELFGDRRLASAIVCSTEAFDEIARFWRTYVATGEELPIEAAFFTSLLEACAWLDLTDAACAAVSRTIEAEAKEVAAPPVSAP